MHSKTFKTFYIIHGVFSVMEIFFMKVHTAETRFTLKPNPLKPSVEGPVSQLHINLSP